MKEIISKIEKTEVFKYLKDPVIRNNMIGQSSLLFGYLICCYLLFHQTTTFNALLVVFMSWSFYVGTTNTEKTSNIMSIVKVLCYMFAKSKKYKNEKDKYIIKDFEESDLCKDLVSNNIDILMPMNKINKIK